MCGAIKNENVVDRYICLLNVESAALKVLEKLETVKGESKTFDR